MGERLLERGPYWKEGAKRNHYGMSQMLRVGDVHERTILTRSIVAECFVAIILITWMGSWVWLRTLTFRDGARMFSARKRGKVFFKKRQVNGEGKRKRRKWDTRTPVLSKVLQIIVTKFVVVYRRIVTLHCAFDKWSDRPREQ